MEVCIQLDRAVAANVHVSISAEYTSICCAWPVTTCGCQHALQRAADMEFEHPERCGQQGRVRDSDDEDFSVQVEFEDGGDGWFAVGVLFLPSVGPGSSGDSDPSDVGSLTFFWFCCC